MAAAAACDPLVPFLQNKGHDQSGEKPTGDLVDEIGPDKFEREFIPVPKGNHYRHPSGHTDHRRYDHTASKSHASKQQNDAADESGPDIRRELCAKLPRRKQSSPVG